MDRQQKLSEQQQQASFAYTIYPPPPPPHLAAPPPPPVMYRPIQNFYPNDPAPPGVEVSQLYAGNSAVGVGERKSPRQRVAARYQNLKVLTTGGSSNAGVVRRVFGQNIANVPNPPPHQLKKVAAPQCQLPKNLPTVVVHNQPLPVFQAHDLNADTRPGATFDALHYCKPMCGPYQVPVRVHHVVQADTGCPQSPLSPENDRPTSSGVSVRIAPNPGSCGDVPPPPPPRTISLSRSTPVVPLKNAYHRGDPTNGPGKENVAPSQDSVPTQPSWKLKTRDQILRDLFLTKDIDISRSHKLGSGRYSKVITAQMLSEKRKIAMKMINTSKVTEDFRSKFLPREIGCWKKLLHPYLVRIHGHYEAMGHVFLTMEFGDGGDLLQHVQTNGAVEGKTAGLWMSQIISGLTYMAQLNIAHRDLKLENIIIFNKTTIKIADFGFCREAHGELSETYCGSKSYSAPEILIGQPYCPYKADVWSVGVIGFVMVTDTMPFRENQPNMKIVEAQKNRAYKYPARCNVADEITSSIDDMLTFSWQDRPDIYECARMPWIQPHVATTDAVIKEYNELLQLHYFTS